MKCAECETEFDPKERRGKPGKLTVCNSCAVEVVEKLTGNLIYSDKTAAELQVNSNPQLTKYLAGGGWGPVEYFKPGSCIKAPSSSPHRRSHS